MWDSDDATVGRAGFLSPAVITSSGLRLDALPTRAGGGHGFSSGGGTHSIGGGGISSGGGGGHFVFFGGGGGGGGAGSIISIVILLIVLLAVVAFVVARRRSPRALVEHPYPHSDTPAYPGGVSAFGGTSAPAPAPAPASAMTAQGAASGLEAIKAHDPDFDADEFKTSVERVFFIVEEAWTEQKPEMSRRVMADGVWQQHRSQIEAQQQQGIRNMLDGLAVGRVDIIAASSDAQHDKLTARILAACADYDVNVADGKVVRGNKHEMGNWQEDWVFERSSQAATKTGGGTLDQKCPNCGAPLDVDLAGVCHYCKAPVMSGAYDWVLARIDQV